jgi:hypothetical protein
MLLNVEKAKRRKRQASGARRKGKKEVVIVDLPTVVAFCLLQNIRRGLQTNIYSRVFQPSMTYSSPDQRPQANLKQCSLKVKPKILSIHQML